MQRIVNLLIENGDLSSDETIFLLQGILKPENSSERQKLHTCANNLRKKVFGNAIYKRGLIEVSNHCKRDCFYCGIRCSNSSIERYRLETDEILDACKLGRKLGFRTFVLQGGEDSFFTADRVETLVKNIKDMYPDCALTLSLGESERAAYQKWFNAGADRYLLRHETADEAYYSKLHPTGQMLSNRKRCLKDLHEIGYQVGTGFMVGLPGQTEENLALDLEFIKELNPQMIGIGPFIPQKDTPLGKEKKGDVDLTLVLISILRIMFPYALLPSTTALGTAAQNGRERGVLAGANVVMPNLTPTKYRALYSIYDNKISTGKEAAEGLEELKAGFAEIGCELVDDRGDYKEPIPKTITMNKQQHS